MTIGERIRICRKEKNLTQKQLGELSGIAEPTIRRYELGKLNPKPKTIKKIADALGVEPFALIESTDYIDLEVSKDFDSALTKMIHHMASQKGFSSASEFYSALLAREIELAILSTKLEHRIFHAYNLLNEQGQLKATEGVEALLKTPDNRIPGYYYFYDESEELKDE